MPAFSLLVQASECPRVGCPPVGSHVKEGSVALGLLSPLLGEWQNIVDEMQRVYVGFWQGL